MAGPPAFRDTDEPPPEDGPRQVEHVLRLTKQLPPAVHDDARPAPHQPGLSRPLASSHDKVLRIRGDGIPAEKSLHPRTLMSQHDPHAARLNLEQQQAARIHLAVSLRALLAPPPPTIRSRTAMDLWLRRPRVRRGITRSSSGPAARRGPHGHWGPARWASP